MKLAKQDSISTKSMVIKITDEIPHIARLLVGPDFRKLLPTSFFIGAGFLILTDTVARTFFPIEIPLSILTAFIGAPFFIGLLIKGGRR